MERWEPVQTETKWILGGRKGGKHHKRILPDYCYNIIELQRRTIYRPFWSIDEIITFKNKKRGLKAKTINDAKKYVSIDWEKLGTVFSLGEKCLRFFERDAEKMLRREGLSKLGKKKSLELYRMLFGDVWLTNKFAEIQSRDPDKPLNQIIDDQFNTSKEAPTKTVSDWHQKATEWDDGAVTNYHTGVALLTTLTGCIGYVDSPRANGGYVAPPVVVTTFVAQDDYVYYPGYEVYYSSSRNQYAYRDGRNWISRPAPRGVSVNVLQASPSVRMDFHDSPASHHAAIARQYPKNWKPAGANQDRNDQPGKRDDRDDKHGR